MVGHGLKQYSMQPAPSLVEVVIVRAFRTARVSLEFLLFEQTLDSFEGVNTNENHELSTRRAIYGSNGA